VIGSSTLAAVRAPADRFDEIATVINDYRQVNHNYARDHEWNMVRCHRRLAEARDEILADIEDRTGCDVLNLPMLTDYYIDLEFPVVNSDRFARESLARRTDSSATRISEEATGGLRALEAELLLEIPGRVPAIGDAVSRYRRERGVCGRGRAAAVERLLESAVSNASAA